MLLPAPLGPTIAITSSGPAVSTASRRPGTTRCASSPVTALTGGHQPAVTQRDQDRDRDDQHHQAECERGVGVGLAGDVDQRRHRLRRARVVAVERDGRPELAERPRPPQHHSGRDPRKSQRHGDPVERRPAGRTERRRGVVVRRAGSAETALDRDRDERQGDEDVGQHDAPCRVGEREAGHIEQWLTEHSRAPEGGAERNAGDDRRQHHRHRDERAHQPSATEVDPRQQPRERKSEDQADQHGGGRGRTRESQSASWSASVPRASTRLPGSVATTIAASGTRSRSTAPAAGIISTSGARPSGSARRRGGVLTVVVTSVTAA